MSIMIILVSTLISVFLVISTHGMKEEIDQLEKWNYRDGAGNVNIYGTRSITGTLEKWGNEIFSEGKYILMYQPQLLLPDYTGGAHINKHDNHQSERAFNSIVNGQGSDADLRTTAQLCKLRVELSKNERSAYGIRSLSEALDDFLRDINSIKKRLGELNDRLNSINRAFIRKRLHMAPNNPATLPRRVLPKWQEKLTHPPHRPSSVKRRVYVRRRRIKT